MKLDFLSASLNQKKHQPSARPYQKFNLVFLSAVFTPLLAVGLFNFVIDPYGVFDSPQFSGLNESKPEKGNRDRLFKAMDIIRVKPVVVLLGSSRTRQGLDPMHPALDSYQPVYNLGLNGVNVYEARRYLQHAITNNQNLKLVVVGIDFFMFNGFNRNQPGFEEYRLNKRSITLQDFVNILFSLDTFNSSKEVIIANINETRKRGESLNGFMPYRNIDLSEDITNWRFENSWNVYFNSHSKYQLSKAYLAEFQKIVDLCKQNSINLKAFISPSHATDGEAIRATGHWSTLEQWKREIVKISPVWDFSGYNSITQEPIGAGMESYADSSHYREEVGNLIMNRLLAYEEHNIPKDFGILITPENIEAHLTKTRVAREMWVQKNIELVSLIQAIKRQQEKKQETGEKRKHELNKNQ